MTHYDLLTIIILLIFLPAVGNDYVGFGPVVLDYSGSSRDNVSEFQITIIDDNKPESTESFEIFGTPNSNLYFPITVMRITIIDNDNRKLYPFC